MTCTDSSTGKCVRSEFACMGGPVCWEPKEEEGESEVKLKKGTGLNQAQKNREIREGRWERYILWYYKIPKRNRLYASDHALSKKTFYTRSKVSVFLTDNPEYEAVRLDKTVQEVVWKEEN